jgi:epoxyqueuosine reductase
MDAGDKTRWVCAQARSSGFDLCGVAPLTGLDDLKYLPGWLDRGHAGEMKYLHDPRRADPKLVMEGGRSLIVVGLNYNSAAPYSTEVAGVERDADAAGSAAPRGWISRYAWGDDYHETLWEKLNGLVGAIRAQWAETGFEARAYADTGPILERVAAKYAGLGWLAKNTCLINQEVGSWLFLGVIITTLDLAPSLAPEQSPAPDRCGTCTLCLDACPTQAFSAPYVLDARRCISYLTIELRTAIPEELRPGMGNAVIGCDICQDVCPWNRKASVTTLAAFQPRAVGRDFEPADGAGSTSRESSATLFAPELEWLASLTQHEFSKAFRHSAIKRAKWRGLVRNACVALGNSNVPRGSASHERIVRLLNDLSHSSDELIAEHARWALARLES